MRPLNSRGSVLLNTLVAGSLVAGTAFYLAQSLTSARRASRPSQEMLVANTYAVELLELFLSENPNRLREQLGTNPINPSNYSPYPLCAPINLMDRTSGAKFVNRDPLADLPSDALLANPNRYYRVEVVNLANTSNITSRRDLCGQNPKYLNLSASERFLVTVGVTWQSEGGSKVASTAISGVLPQAAGTPPPTPTPVPTVAPCSPITIHNEWNVRSYIHAISGQYIIPEGNALLYDSATAVRACQLLKAPVVVAFNGPSNGDPRWGYTSPGDNGLMQWNPNTSSWIFHNAAAVGNRWIGMISCGCPTPPVLPQVMFVSSRTYNGREIGGLTGGDAICANLALNASEPLVKAQKNWKAILSTPSESARDRIAIAARVINSKGTLLANNPVEFWGNTFAAPVTYSENGRSMPGTQSGESSPGYESVWTGSNTNGSYRAVGKAADGACRNWTSDSSSIETTVGNHLLRNGLLNDPSSGKSGGADSDCGERKYIYCISQ